MSPSRAGRRDADEIANFIAWCVVHGHAPRGGDAACGALSVLNLYLSR